MSLEIVGGPARGAINLISTHIGVTFSTYTPTGAAFDIVLIFHVGSFLVAFASILTTGTQAWRARSGPESPGAASVARFFKPGINWPGRAIYLVIVLGVVLIAVSQHAYGFSDPFVQIGLVLWILVVASAEMVVWPGERRLQALISEGWSSVDEARQVATRVALSAWAVTAVLIVATVVMVDKP